MKEVIVDTNFWKVFPKATIEILSVDGIDNHVTKESKETCHQLLSEATKEARNYPAKETLSQDEVTARWRQVFTTFKTKKGARSSIEALLRRANQEWELFPINPLVDICNSISLSFGISCGGRDIEKIAGNLHLRKAQGGEPFLSLGANSDAPTLPEEIVYYGEQGAICRCLNWHEAQRTVLAEETQAAVLVIESVNVEQAAHGAQVVEALKEKIDQAFGVASVRHTLTRDESEAEL